MTENRAIGEGVPDGDLKSTGGADTIVVWDDGDVTLSQEVGDACAYGGLYGRGRLEEAHEWNDGFYEEVCEIGLNGLAMFINDSKVNHREGYLWFTGISKGEVGRLLLAHAA